MLPTSAPAARHICFCGKSYARREHLRRHQTSHDQKKHICGQCGAAFARTDILRRHVREHASPNKRPKACDACHSNKTKCNGGEQCSLCTRRGIPCTYSSSDSRASVSVMDVEEQNDMTIVIPDDTDVLLPIGATTEPEQTVMQASSPVVFLGAVEVPAHPRSEMAERLQQMLQQVLHELDKPASQRGAMGGGTYPADLMQAVYDQYVEHFHPHWTLVHGPTFEFWEVPFETAVIVFLIGAFCWNQADNTLGLDQSLFFQIHGKLMGHWFRHLYEPRHVDIETEPWPTTTYQGILLTIIFATYLNEEESVQKANLLVNLFINALRTTDYFCSSTATRQRLIHFPGDFIPWKYMLEQQWKRIIAYCLKIDAHLAILTQQPPCIQLCELDATLPDTFSQMMGYGLDVFWARHEPMKILRKETSITSFFEDPQPTFNTDMLSEDVHLGLCGLANKTWRLAQLRRVGKSSQEATTLQADLAARLLSWRKHLQTQSVMMKKCPGFRAAYLGREERPEPIMSSLNDESLALYHLLALLVNTHSPSDLDQSERSLDPDRPSKAVLLPPLAMKSVYHALCIGALCLSRDGCRPAILHHARVFAREFLESMLENECWCRDGGSRLELASKDIRLDQEEGVCATSLGPFWLSVDGVPLCACEQSNFLSNVGLG
ncbi:hypothetical protein F5X68DRAFT_228341 [Plectosphaerella plurivora]|uniref:Zn(2)-C6 fungal-type domain-containing protein n=1 Tax=Plectosphaerella plurivora TaxID=936078 RepID=A0A9P9ABY6_9PEZI|nr:hypothetical protein F5X68DRAFT_228341 [Plectosphaerella plurivora]